jgi:hypothetical protein
LQVGRHPRPGTGDEREDPSPLTLPRSQLVRKKGAILVDRESGLGVLQERGEHSDADQTAHQQDEEREDGTPYLSGGQTIGHKDRHRQHFEPDAGCHQPHRAWAEVRELETSVGTRVKADEGTKPNREEPCPHASQNGADGKAPRYVRQELDDLPHTTSFNG